MSEPVVDLVEHGVTLIGHLAWPLVVVVLLVLVRKEARNIAAALAARVGNPDSDVSIGRDGLKISQTARSEAEVETETGPLPEGRLEAWLLDQDVDISLTSFLYGDEYADMRKQALRDLNS